MKNIAYYISSHGFGHAARQQAVVNQLAQCGVSVHVRTAAPQKFFRKAASYHAQRYDVGMIQHDAMSFDIAASLKWYADFLHNQQTALIAQEVAFIRETDIGLIVTDMPPIACEIAAAAGVPCVAVTHFTWDWVYDYYTDDFPQYRYLIDAIRASYSKATLALQMQLPIPHEFDMFPVIEPVPLVFNPATQSREQLYAALSIPAGCRVALLSMGGHSWARGNLSRLKALDGWMFLVGPDMWHQVEDDPTCFRQIAPDMQDYHNLIACADVVVGKAGGSTVAEVLGHRTPMIYTTQAQWREAQLLDATLSQYAVSAHVESGAFEAGAWVDLLDWAADPAHVWPDIPVDGAQVAARRLLSLL